MTKTRKGYRKVNQIRTDLHKPKLEIDEVDGEVREKIIDQINEAYKFVERRELTVKSARDLPAMGGVYSAQLLKISKSAEPESDDFEDMNKPDGVLKLPVDGSIFHDGIPFHHFSLTSLQPKHIRRLKNNGIELKQTDFSYLEDRQIRENWQSFALAHELSEDEAPRYMSAATSTETQEDHRERIRFIRKTLFRPWMCSRLLDRTAGQVFRRCYHLYHVSNFQSEDDIRIWTEEEDRQLIELVRIHGRKWEFIGNEMLRCRYHCCHRFELLEGSSRQKEHEQDYETPPNEPARSWSRVEIARLYEYLCDHLQRNPVLVALIARYQHFDEEVNWADPRMRLPERSGEERREKWNQLKAEFQSAKERLQTENAKKVLREVIPEDTRIVSKARTQKRAEGHEHGGRTRKGKPEDHTKWTGSVREYCEGQRIERVRDIDRKELEKKLQSEGLLDSAHFKCRWRQFRFLLFTAHCVGMFKILPIEEDRLTVHLKLWEFVFQNISTMKVKKRTLRKYSRRFVRIQGWEQRQPIILVDRKQKSPGKKELIKTLKAERDQIVRL